MGGWQARGRVGNDKLVRNWVILTLRFSIGLMTDLSAILEGGVERDHYDPTNEQRARKRCESEHTE